MCPHIDFKLRVCLPLNVHDKIMYNNKIHRIIKMTMAGMGLKPTPT